MAFSGEGAVGGAASGAAAGSVAGPWGAVVGGALGGIAGGFMGGKKKKKIDISQQLALLQQGTAQQKFQNEMLSKDLAPLTTDYRTQLQGMLAGGRKDFDANKTEFLGATNANTMEAQDALRRNLYSENFNALPDTLQAVREASAAGGGLKTGSYQKAVGDVGRTVGQNIATGERDIQIAGLQNRQAAQETTFNAFNQLSSKLSDQQLEGLTKVLDTGRADLVRQYGVDMGLTEQEIQGTIDLLNFQQSGEMAADTAGDANKQALLNSLFTMGGTIAGNYKKGTKTVAPTPK